MISLDRALALVDEIVQKRSRAQEIVDINQALGRICITSQLSRVDLPPFHKSLVDGYALPGNDAQASYRVLEVVPAGAVPRHALTRGTAVKVMTGAPLPAGTARVVKIEDTEDLGDRVRIVRASAATHICVQGRDMRIGDTVLEAPVRLSPVDIGNLAGAGVTRIPVSKDLTAAILCTGDEIIDHPDALRPGCILNVNGPLLEALCRQQGIDVVLHRHVPDTAEATHADLRLALEQADLVLLSGGVSVGDFDYVGAAMRDLGLQVPFDRVAVKPGKPMTFGHGDQGLVFGLPGNPVAVYLLFHLFVLRAARGWAGLPAAPRFCKRPLARAFKRRAAERREFLPCRISRHGEVHPLAYHGSAHLQALKDAHGFWVMPEGVTTLDAGAEVDYVALTGGLA
jgi:molybdopterin molybdotransferase